MRAKYLPALILFIGITGTMASAPVSHAQLKIMDTGTAAASTLDKNPAKTSEEIPCEKITDEEFEELGEAWMDRMHPNPELHERMDAMMGGEGSQTLKQAHIAMGKRSLGCGPAEGRGWGGYMMGMMPWAGMMGGWGRYGGGFNLFWFSWIVSWILLNILLLVLIRYFWKKGSSEN